MSGNRINFDYIHKSDASSSDEHNLNYIEKYNIIVNYFKSPENNSCSF